MPESLVYSAKVGGKDRFMVDFTLSRQNQPIQTDRPFSNCLVSESQLQRSSPAVVCAAYVDPLDEACCDAQNEASDTHTCWAVLLIANKTPLTPFVRVPTIFW